MTSVADYASSFDEEPGFLDYARVGPIGRVVREETLAMSELLGRARFGAVDRIMEQDARVREAVAALTGFRADQVAFQPSTSYGLMHATFGLTGSLALAPSEFPSLPFAAVRAEEALGAIDLQWLETDDGRVTAGTLRDQLADSTTAVAVSLVDFRTGYLTDLDGIRQVIGDRLLLVDATQGFGVVDAPWGLVDVLVSGGQKWVRAGWGTGFLAMSDRAVDALTPVFSGFPASEVPGMPLDEVPPPASSVRAFTVSNPDPIAEARLAAALEDIARVGVAEINAAVLERSDAIIRAADEFGMPVLSSRAPHERAGIVVLAPPADQLTVLTASLHNHGISYTSRGGQVRLSAHASTDDETIEMLRSALTSFATAVNV